MHKNIELAFYTLYYPIWVGDLGTEPENQLLKSFRTWSFWWFFGDFFYRKWVFGRKNFLKLGLIKSCLRLLLGTYMFAYNLFFETFQSFALFMIV